jgi:hypothetical protein
VIGRRNPGFDSPAIRKTGIGRSFALRPMCVLAILIHINEAPGWIATYWQWCGEEVF